MNKAHKKGKHIARKRGTLVNLFAGLTAASFVAVSAFTSWALLDQQQTAPAPELKTQEATEALSSLGMSGIALPPEGGAVLWRGWEDAAGLPSGVPAAPDESAKPLSDKPERGEGSPAQDSAIKTQADPEPEKTEESEPAAQTMQASVFASVSSGGKQPDSLEYLGEFITTAYCPCELCCGKGAKGITSTGTKATQGRTVAVDPDVIPLGSVIYIGGKAYTAEDTGSGIKGKRLDIFFNSHQDALNWGERAVEVWLQK